ncbi:cation:proton antiporter [Galbitalea sp. SE-J8]|uniref:cation:proton antiporter n=1 Tax=Galbitalea sp. SE-J8 TaxID=3054952 RepID=UPI00259C6DF0|nr:cation:proton antiporter [Galbitalea sp. SE-J8]MDM4762881.1 cation:proton antiporter [Galbitalea sp. SE-J8]
MDLALFAIVAVLTIVAAGAFSKRLGVATPIILILVGIGFSYIPGAPTEFDPEIILVGLLPPILYSAAITVPVVDFRRNLTSIGALSVLLVVVSAFASGLLLYFLLPDLSLPAAIAVGAVISPPDAVAATAVGKRLGLPPRLTTILEGEGLVNDATALTMLKAAIAAVSATLSFWGAIGDFVYAVVVAIVVGLVIGFISVRLREKLPDSVLQTAISFAVPFVAFILAEDRGASGVLAVVVTGLYTGHESAKRFSAQSRITERINWRTAQFVLENVVFLIMGVQISSIIVAVDREGTLPLGVTVLVGALVTAVLIGIRFVFVAPLLLLLRRQNSRARSRNTRFGEALQRVQKRIEGDERFTARYERARREHQRRVHDAEELRREGLGWRGGIVIGWSGMRGVVTLAAAQTLPTDADDWPYRPQLVLIAFVVAVITLVLQGGTLPLVIRLTGIRGPDRAADENRFAELLGELAEAGAAAVDDPTLEVIDGQPFTDEERERVKHEAQAIVDAARERAEEGVDEPEDVASSPHRRRRVLVHHMIEAQREALLEARSEGTYPSRLIERAQAMLDLEQTRIEAADGRTT